MSKLTLERPDKSLRMVAGRDSLGNSLTELKGYSSTVVKQAFTECKPIVVTGTDEGKALGSESAVAHNLRSIMAVPLRVREKVLGVVYLDSRLAKGLFTSEDLDLLSAISNHIAIAFETSRMANVEAERRVLEKEVALVGAVQSFFLPREDSFSSEKLALKGHYQPATQASGDWWWYKYQESGKMLTVILGDVTGHGAASAMLTASTAGLFQAMVRERGEIPIEAILAELNLGFLEFSHGDYSMTMGAIQIDAETGRLRLISAGGPSIYVMDGEGKTQVVVVAGTPLGDREFKLGVREVILTPGSRVCMFTDGITEMFLPGGGMLRSKNFLRIFGETKGLHQDQAQSSMLDELRRLRGDTPLADDMTLILVDYLV